MTDPHAEAELPTDAMIEAGLREYSEGGNIGAGVVRAIWRAMEAVGPTIVSDEAVADLARQLGDAIANLGYPVGMGLKPNPETMVTAIRNILKALEK